MSALSELIAGLRASRGFAHKTDISDVVGALARATPPDAPAAALSVPIGDDCAAMPDGQGGHHLLAIEGLVEDFIVRMPWFAGYSAVMVNISDIYAMGGRPTAVVNALWSTGMNPAREMIEGMASACARYGVPMVGGHSNNRSDRPQLAVAIAGHAKKLLTSFNARPGDSLLMAVDLRGQWQDPFPYWNASTQAPAQRLRDDLDLLPRLAESGRCDAAKDISMAGVLGTALMLLECSGVGARVDLDAIPHPGDVPMLRWLTAFPSYGFILSVRPGQAQDVIGAFAGRGLACAAIGEVTAGRRLVLRQGDEQGLLWDIDAQPFIRAAQPRPAGEMIHA
ncbi:MAG TPA: sll0787 family AIR synthase-like protein [Bordetella sp.]